ncbi:MAG: Xaa-Pro aminopeptidase [Candidatus Poriferisodalaceae bacterium]|jgi:Xaa-Pro aminopeptidase|tara:strand:- start:7574 stop:8845 length:1272 start_codon:yes stop_codon:yes gene_type:complete
MTSIDSRRKRVVKNWGLTDEIIIVRSGSLVPIDGTDMHYPYQPHPNFAYLAAVGVPEALLAYDAQQNHWETFGPRATADELVWEQSAQNLGIPVAELEEWLASRPNRKICEANTDPRLNQGIGEARIYKDEDELEDLRSAALTSQAGFDWVFANASVGMTEREIQVGMEAEFFKAGAPRTAYQSIVASGPNGAFLHFFYGQDDTLRPTSRSLEAGDMLLIDAGGQIGGYASDVTRSMVVGAEPTDIQNFLWHLIQRTQEVAIDRCRPGAEWREIHLESAKIIGSGLIELGLMKGDIDSLVSSGAVALFYPHGLGHLIGLAVHDSGGYQKSREPSSHPQLRYLRTDRVLETGMITSVEPGVYFIEALLGDPKNQHKFADEVNFKLADDMKNFGGIRIEDDIHITDKGPENLSSAIAKPLVINWR